MHVITLFSAVWGTQQLVVVCGTTFIDNQLSRCPSSLLRMSSFRFVVLDTMQTIVYVWTMQGVV